MGLVGRVVDGKVDEMLGHKGKGAVDKVHIQAYTSYIYVHTHTTVVGSVVVRHSIPLE